MQLLSTNVDIILSELVHKGSGSVHQAYCLHLTDYILVQVMVGEKKQMMVQMISISGICLVLFYSLFSGQLSSCFQLSLNKKKIEPETSYIRPQANYNLQFSNVGLFLIYLYAHTFSQTNRFFKNASILLWINSQLKYFEA